MKKFSLKKLLTSTFKIFLTVYVLFGIFLFMNQKSILYYPTHQNFETCESFQDYQKINHNGTRFYLKENSKDKIIVYYHGNAGSACDRSLSKETFEQNNASVIFVEYAGYSNDTVKPSQKLILQDVENVHNYIKQNSYKNIIVYGQSIGSGAASYHASLNNVDQLILATPFSTLKELAQSKYIIYPTALILTERYNNLEWLKNYQGDILIIHGNNDQIIPHKFSQKLFNQLNTKNKEYVLIKKAGHNDIWSFPEFKNKISEFIN